MDTIFSGLWNLLIYNAEFSLNCTSLFCVSLSCISLSRISFSCSTNICTTCRLTYSMCSSSSALSAISRIAISSCSINLSSSSTLVNKCNAYETLIFSSIYSANLRAYASSKSQIAKIFCFKLILLSQALSLIRSEL